MHRFILPFQALLLTGLTQASPVGFKHTLDARNEQIQWVPCNFSSVPVPLPTLCANLSVPLDYTDSNSQDTWPLELTKIEAVKGPAKGTVFMNYGGPGLSGLSELPAYGLYQQAVTGGEYDLINIVPRGTGFNLPFQCFNTSEERLASSSLIGIAGSESELAQGRLWSGAQIYDATCLEAQSKLGEVIGTAFVARDIIYVADLLGETDVNYWGISYGTLLGQTLAQMFPDRMNKVIFDGVVNGFEYYNNSEVQMFTNMDETFAGFCEYCAAAGDSCLLAQGNRTADEISQTVYDLLEQVRLEPIPVVVPGGGLLVDYSMVRLLIINDLYGPSTWPTMDYLLYSAITGNTTALLEYVSAQQLPSPVPATEALRGVRCSDIVTREAELSGIQHTLDARYELSRIGGDFFDANTMTNAKERVLPELGSTIQTKHPVMLLANSFDPVTSIESARNTSARFEGSVVLETNGYGHGSVAQGSLCQARLTQAYFVNGTLPDPDTICEVDLPFFSTSIGLSDIVEALGFDQYNTLTAST